MPVRSKGERGGGGAGGRRVRPKTSLPGSGDGRADEETGALCKGDKDIAIISRTIVNLS